MKKQLDKKRLMWLVVIFFFILIFIFWLLTFQTQKADSQTGAIRQAYNEVEQPLKDLKEQFIELRQIYDSINKDISEKEISNEQLEYMKEIINQEEKEDTQTND
jgi:predicted PurR-regulated permease PerM